MLTARHKTKRLHGPGKSSQEKFHYNISTDHNKPSLSMAIQAYVLALQQFNSPGYWDYTYNTHSGYTQALVNVQFKVTS